MRYICLECGYEFDEPMTWVETHGLEHGPYERWSGCPICGEGFAEKGSVDYPYETTNDRYTEVLWPRKLTTQN